MAGQIENRLRELGIRLPQPQAAKVAKILPAKRVGNLLFVSGQLPQWEGDIRFVGKLGKEFDLAKGQEAARLSALNVLAQAKKALDGDLDRVRQVVKVMGFVNAVPDFAPISEVVNGASDLFVQVFGEAGKHARTAIGAATMPFSVAIEVEAIFEIA